MKKLKQLSEERNVKLDIRPYKPYFDKRQKVAFAMNYAVYDAPCPFLIDNRCSIHADRPLICRKFPIAISPYFEILRSKGSTKPQINLSNFYHCKNFNNKDFLKLVEGTRQRSEVDKQYRAVYGDCYDDAIHSEMIVAGMANLLEYIIKNGYVKLRKIKQSDLDKLTIVPFFDFLKTILPEETCEKAQAHLLDKDAVLSKLRLNE